MTSRTVRPRKKILLRPELFGPDDMEQTVQQQQQLQQQMQQAQQQMQQFQQQMQQQMQQDPMAAQQMQQQGMQMQQQQQQLQMQMQELAPKVQEVQEAQNLYNEAMMDQKATNIKDEARANRLARSHGKRTMKLIEEAITELNRGNTAGFAIRIHGICAAHVVRTSVMQQKIGLHLISNLGIRKETRLVGAQNVPDIAQYLKTGFHFGKVLHILQRSKIIKWNCIEKDVVQAAVKKLRP